MDRWLHAQFKVAENLLEAVDRNISINVNSGSNEVPTTSSQDNAHPTTANTVTAHTNLPASSRPGLATEGIWLSSTEVAIPSRAETSSLPQSSIQLEDSIIDPQSQQPTAETSSAVFNGVSSSPLSQTVNVVSPTTVSAKDPALQGSEAATFVAPVDNVQPAVEPAPMHGSIDVDQSGADTTTGSGNRELRLSRLVEHLKRRLDEQRAENQQLEELLQKAESRSSEHADAAHRLQQELDKVLQDRMASESSLAAQLTAKDVEASRLSSSLEAAQRQVAVLEAARAVLEERNAALVAGQDQVEAGMLEALKAELKSVEAQLESERRQHQSSKAGASARQEELEHHLSESAAALSSMQRKLEQAGARTMELEERLALLQAQHKHALEQHEASSSPHYTDGTPKRISQADGPSLEVEALREEVARSRAALQAAEKARRMAETSAANLRQELADVRAGTNQPTSQLEHEVKEMSEMLYIKQTQLERLAAEKASQQLVLERDLAAAREELNRLRVSSQQRYDSRPANDALIPMDALGEPYQRLARHNKLGAAVTTVAGCLDTTTSRFVYILRHYPLGRVVVFLYLVAMHLCLYFLTVRLQHLAVRQEAAQLQPIPALDDHSLPGGHGDFHG